MSVAVCALIATILFFDQFCKFLILKYIGLNTTFDIIKGAFSITPILNPGGGFGILPNQTFLLITTSLITIIFIICLLLKQKIKEKLFLFSLAMILAGALGNLIDRLRLSAVIDFIDFKVWPVFNIADSFITIGAVILAYAVITGNRTGKQSRKP